MTRFIQKLAPALMLISSGCSAEPDAAQTNSSSVEATGEQKFETGNAGIDAFLTAVASQDEASVAEQLGSVQSLSGRPAGFSDAQGYLARVKDCAIQKAVKDAPGTAWVYWTCPDRSYRQTIDTKYAAPKMTVTELY